MDEIRTRLSLWQKSGSPDDRSELLKCIWQQYHRKLQVYACQFQGSPQDAPDRASEILLKVFESLGAYNPRYSFSTWLYTLARNCMVDRCRDKNPETVPLSGYEHSESSCPEAMHIKEEECRAVEKALCTLEKRDREIIFLHYYENLKYREIAKISGIPAGTVKYRVHEAKKRLAAELERSLL